MFDPFRRVARRRGWWLAVAGVASAGCALFLYAPAALAKRAIPPTVMLYTDGGTFSLGEVEQTIFGCYSSNSMVAPLVSCVDSNGVAGTGSPSSMVGSGQLDTSVLGRFKYTVTATDASSDPGKTGATATASFTYAVAAPPTATIKVPADGGIYNATQVLDASYKCAEGKFGPGLATSNGCAGPVADGAQIDTNTVGQYSFSVNATSQDLQTGAATSTYTVVYPTGTAVVCDPDSVAVNQATTCTATLTTQPHAGAPTGTVGFSSSKAGSFTPASCTLSPDTGLGADVSTCSVSFTPTVAGSQKITAAYGGDSVYHGTSSGTTKVTT